MNPFRKLTAGLCALALAVSSAPVFGGTMSAGAVSTVANPIIWADVPDCDVIRVGDTYY